MQLRLYLEQYGLSYADFARRVGSNHARTVERYAKGMQRPNAVMMKRVVRATEGAVTPNDFFGVMAGYEPEEVA